MSRVDAMVTAGVRATRCALLAAETVGTLRTERARDGQGELLQRAAQTALGLHGVQLQVTGRLSSSPAVIVANHESWLDALVMLALLPAVPLAKREVLSWPVIGPMASSFGAVFVRRGDAHSGAVALRHLRQALSQGRTVVGFPEGTTSANGVLPFRRGLFGLALHARVPVVPVALAWRDPRAAWVGNDAFVPHWLSLCHGDPLHVDVRVGRPLLPGAEPDHLAEAAREQIVMMLEGGRSA